MKELHRSSDHFLLRTLTQPSGNNHSRSYSISLSKLATAGGAIKPLVGGVLSQLHFPGNDGEATYKIQYIYRFLPRVNREET